MAGDLELGAVARGNRAYVGDNAGEHLLCLCHQVMRSGPKVRAWVGVK